MSASEDYRLYSFKPFVKQASIFHHAKRAKAFIAFFTVERCSNKHLCGTADWTVINNMMFYE